jgi:hypothetical protein
MITIPPYRLADGAFEVFSIDFLGGGLRPLASESRNAIALQGHVVYLCDGPQLSRRG